MRDTSVGTMQVHPYGKSPSSRALRPALAATAREPVARSAPTRTPRRRQHSDSPGASTHMAQAHPTTYCGRERSWPCWRWKTVHSVRQATDKRTSLHPALSRRAALGRHRGDAVGRFAPGAPRREVLPLALDAEDSSSVRVVHAAGRKCCTARCACGPGWARTVSK